MKSSIKRVFALLLAAFVVLSIAPARAYAEGEDDTYTVYFTYEGDVSGPASITVNKGNSLPSACLIPSLSCCLYSIFSSQSDIL